MRRSPFFEQDDTYPAVCISWYDSQAYTQWLSKVTGKRYRLPSEAEWEYAVRAGSKTKYHFGDDEARLCDYANHADTSTDDGRNELCSDGFGDKTAPVGSFKPNVFGLYDMHGNAWEWVQDCWHDDYNGAPTDGSAWESENCNARVRRGGSWFYGTLNLTSTNRDSVVPFGRTADIGFRVVQDL